MFFVHIHPFNVLINQTRTWVYIHPFFSNAPKRLRDKPEIKHETALFTITIAPSREVSKLTYETDDTDYTVYSDGSGHGN